MDLAITARTERKIRVASSIAYAVSLMVSVIFFEFQISFLSQGILLVLWAYVTVVLFAALISYKISHWYFPVENLQPKLEVFLVPIVVVFTSSIPAGLSFGIASELSLVQKGSNFVESLQLGLFSGVMFIVGAWPVLLFSTIATSLLIVEYQKKLLTSR